MPCEKRILSRNVICKNKMTMIFDSVSTIEISNDSDIINLSKSASGKYLSVLFRDSLQIRNQTNIFSPIQAEYRRSPEQISKYGFNNWLEWLGNDMIVIGTQTGNLIFLNFNSNGKITEKQTISTNKIITSHCVVFKALAVGVLGPLILFYSPHGMLLSTVSINNASSNIIRCMSNYNGLLGLAFSNGSASTVEFKQEDLIQQKTLESEELPFNNVASIKVVKNQILVQTFDGSLYRMNSLKEISFICDGSNVYDTKKDDSNIISLSNNGVLTIYSTETTKSTTVEINFDLKEKNGFISGEIDSNGIRFYCATSKDLFVILLAVQNKYLQNNIYHTIDSIYLPIQSGLKLKVPNDLINDLFPIVSVAQSENEIIAAGRKNFVIFSKTTKKWKIIKNQNYFCSTLWYQNPYFISLIYNQLNLKFELLLFSSKFEELNHIELNSTFIDIDFIDNIIAIGYPNNIKIYEISNDEILFKQKYNIEELDYQKVILTGNESIAILNNEKEFINVSDKKLILEGVSYVQSSGKLIYIISHSQQFIYFDSKLIKINESSILYDKESFYLIPKSYKINDEFKLKKTEYFSKLFLGLIDYPESINKLINYYVDFQVSKTCFSRILEYLLKNKMFDILNSFLPKIEKKNEFLIISLSNIAQKFYPVIKNLLPSEDVLKNYYSKYSEEIKKIYN